MEVAPSPPLQLMEGKGTVLGIISSPRIHDVSQLLVHIDTSLTLLAGAVVNISCVQCTKVATRICQSVQEWCLHRGLELCLLDNETILTGADHIIFFWDVASKHLLPLIKSARINGTHLKTWTYDSDARSVQTWRKYY